MEFNDEIKNSMMKYAGLSKEDVDKIEAVPVGDPRRCSPSVEWDLPDRQSWFTEFWYSCTDKLRDEALPTLLSINEHREVNSINPHSVHSQPRPPDPFEQPDVIADDESRNPPSVTSSVEIENYTIQNHPVNHTMQNHPICTFCTISRRLQEENSSLRQYIKSFVAKRGFEGFFHAFLAYLKYKSPCKCKPLRSADLQEAV